VIVAAIVNRKHHPPVLSCRDDGIKVNIAPLARTGLLRIKGRLGEKNPEN